MKRAKIRSGSSAGAVHIAGESPLVEEFAELCAHKGMRVTAQWNEPGTVPKGVRRSSSMSPGTGVAIELTNTDSLIKKKNLQKLDRALGRSGILLTSSVTVSATEQASWIGHAEHLIGISALPSLASGSLIEFAPAAQTDKASIVKAQEFFIQLGKQVSVVQDRVGMVLPRVLCMIINEAYFALQEGIAAPEEIDLAMKLGTNYPHGPVEWAQRLGIRQVHAVLEALRRDLGEERHRVAPLLKQMALRGEW